MWNNVEGKNGKNTALEYFYHFVSVNVVPKEICSYINSMTGSRGKSLQEY